MNEMQMPTKSHATTQPLDLGKVPEMQHTVDTNLLIQDSHIHIMIYAIVAALLTLIILGLDWPAWWRDTVIVAAFATGALDFAGQWLMKFGHRRLRLAHHRCRAGACPWSISSSCTRPSGPCCPAVPRGAHS